MTKPLKKAILHRFGAFGDSVIITPVLPLLKRDGYEITLNTTQRGMDVLKCNPYIEHFLEHDTSIPPDERLEKHLKALDSGYDLAINFCESIEGSLAKVEWRKDFYWSKEKRHEECNKNFYDFTLDWAGYGDVKGKNGELYFSPLEESMARKFRNKYKNKFVILWGLAGSSVHKAYPYTEFVARKLLDTYEDIVIMTVGDNLCEMLEWSHPRTKNYSGKWPIRKSFIMTKYADLVIGPDTGLMHAAGCFDTPKILFLSSNTEENLSKYWKNTTVLNAGVDCQPCHRLHYGWEHCDMDWQLNAAKCTSEIPPVQVYNDIIAAYDQWKEKNYVRSSSGSNRRHHRDGSPQQSISQ